MFSEKIMFLNCLEHINTIFMFRKFFLEILYLERWHFLQKSTLEKYTW